MKSSVTPSRPWSLLNFLVLPLLALTLAQAALAAPGENGAAVSSAAAADHNSLTQFKVVVGQVVLSEDACGTNTPAPTSSCTVDIVKPSPAATVREADLFCATTGGSGYSPMNGDVTVNAVPVTWAQIVPNAIESFNGRADVTTTVKPVGDAAPPGLVTFTITENPTFAYDGCILKVIWDDPTTTQNSILIFWGAQETTGDTFVINFAPLTPAALATPLEFSLGISFGAQGPCALDTQQFSQVDVDGTRLTTSAGGEDDGACANGALITVGGTGDTAANPPAFAPHTLVPSVPDDELYDLRPFVMAGDTSMTIFTLNPSNDDNIFIANLFLRNVTVVEPPPPCPPDDDNGDDDGDDDGLDDEEENVLGNLLDDSDSDDDGVRDGNDDANGNGDDDEDEDDDDECPEDDDDDGDGIDNEDEDDDEDDD